MNSTNLTPAKAAEQILNFYDTIPAMSPKAFAAGLVEILSNYPQAVIDRAASPSRGLAGVIAYPNLAKFKEKLDAWSEEYYFDVERERKKNLKLLPEPPVDPEMQARIAKGLKELADHLRSGFGPSTI